jgi:hypothetical protein
MTQAYRPNRQPEKDIAGMKDPDIWPQWPLLPLKRYEQGSHRMQTGYLVAQEKDRWSVYLGNVWAVQITDPAQPYDSPEAIVADGWEVD